MNSNVLLSLFVVFVFVLEAHGLFFGGGAGGGGGGGRCCPPPPCGGGCGGRRKKRSIPERDSESSAPPCNSHFLQEIIEESIVDNDIDKSLLHLNERLEHEMNDADDVYVAWCSDTMKSFKFATQLNTFCALSNANVTCNVFHH